MTIVFSSYTQHRNIQNNEENKLLTKICYVTQNWPRAIIPSQLQDIYKQTASPVQA